MATPRPGAWLAEAMARLGDLPAVARAHPGYDPAGYGPLREMIASRYQEVGLPTSPDNIIVTNGATQALHLLIAAITRPGDRILVEELTCPTVLAAIRTARLEPIALPLGRDGVAPLALERAIRRYQPACCYLIPTHHNPTGRTLGRQRRAGLASVFARSGVPLIEDLALAEVTIDDLAPPPIAAYASGAEVYVVGSLSKVYWQGLRIGWVRGPRLETERLLRLRAVQDLGGALPTQMLALELLKDEANIRDERRTELAAKRDLLLAELARQLPQWWCARPSGGLSVWCRAPRALRGLRERANACGLPILLGDHFAVDGRSFLDHIRIPFVLEEPGLVEAIGLLAKCWYE